MEVGEKVNSMILSGGSTQIVKHPVNVVYIYIYTIINNHQYDHLKLAGIPTIFGTEVYAWGESDTTYVLVQQQATFQDPT